VLLLLFPAAVGFAAAPPALRSLGEAGAGKAQPQTPQQKQEQQIFGQLTKAWSALYADKYEDAVKQAEAVVAKAGTQYRNLALEAVHVQARAYLAQGSKPAQAKARQLWQQLEQSAQLAKTSPSGAPATRVKIAKALELEAAAGGEPLRTAGAAGAPSPLKGEVAASAGGGGVNPAKPIDQAKLKLAIDALEAVVKAGQPSPAAAEAGIDLARLYCKAHRPDDAKAALQAVIDMMSGKDNITRMEIPEALAKVYVNAAKAAMKDIKYDVNDGLAEFEAAEKLRDAKKFADAMKAYQSVAQNFPKTDYAPRSELHIGDCLLGLGQPAAAMAHWKKFIAPAPAGPWRGQAYVGIIDYCLEEQLDLPEAGKYADLARNSLPSALHSLGDAGAAALGMGVPPMRPTGILPVDNSPRSANSSSSASSSGAAASWSLVAFDIHLRVGLVSFCQGNSAQAVAAFEAAKAATTNKAAADSLDSLIAAAKTGKSVIPEDCFAAGSSSSSGSGGSPQSAIRNPQSAIDRPALALSMGIIHLLAGRPDNADNMFDRILGRPSVHTKIGASGANLIKNSDRPASPLQGSTPAQLAFATFGRGAVLQARKKLDDAKAQFLASIKAFPAGSWHDETLYRLATITQDQANPSPSKGEVPPPAPKGAGPGGGVSSPIRPGAPGQSAIRNESSDDPAALAARQRQATRIISAKSEALSYWQELINRYPKSPRCEQAFYNAGVLLCEIAETSDAAASGEQGRTTAAQSEKKWKDAAFMLGRFTEFYPKSPFAGDAYVREIDIALERMFDLNLAQQLAAMAVDWAKAQPNPRVEESAPGLESWRATVKRIGPTELRPVIFEAYLRAGLVAYLDRRYEAAQKFFESAQPLTPPRDFVVVEGRIPTGIECIIAASREKRALTPKEALEGDAKTRLVLQLSDIYLEAGAYLKTRELASLVIGDQRRISSGPQLSWAHRQRAVALSSLRLKLEAKPEYLAAQQTCPTAPWAGECLFMAGTIVHNHEKKPDDAIAVFEEVVKRYPTGEYAAKAAYFIGVIHEWNSRWSLAKAAYQRVIRDYPESRWASAAMDYHLKNVNAALAAGKSDKNKER
jgi:tetratricopeptide (TPR) repeat protein